MDADAGRRDEIRKELERIEESAISSAQTQFSSSKQWRAINLALGTIAAALAAIAGAAGLTDVLSIDNAAIVALASAALTAVMTTLNASQRADQSQSSANAYLALAGDARVVRTVDLPYVPVDEARARLDELAGRRNAISETAPVAAFLAYRLGQRNLRKGRQTYAVDKTQ
jgi:hypothetical protein